MGLALALMFPAVFEAAGAETPAPAREAPIRDWDQPANIRDAAQRIGNLQRTQGADAAIRHIDACYRTHGLAESYRAPFEACIVQDYLVTKMLVQVYGRLPPDAHQRTGAPSADALAQAMGRRMVAAFSQYDVSASEAEAFKGEIDQYGLPVFLKIVLPQAAGEIEALEKKNLKQKKN